MTPGSVLILSGALILVAVSAYDAVSSSVALGALRRRRIHAAPAAPSNPMFSARLARYGITAATQADADAPAPAPQAMSTEREFDAACHAHLVPTPLSDGGLPATLGAQAFVDVLADLDAFDRWLRDSRAVTPPQAEGQARHLPPACALFAPEDETTRASPASPAQDIHGHPMPRRFAHLDPGDDADAATWLH